MLKKIHLFFILLCFIFSLTSLASEESCNSLLKKILENLPQKKSISVDAVSDDRIILGLRNMKELEELDDVEGDLFELPLYNIKTTEKLNQKTLNDLLEISMPDSKKYPLLTLDKLTKLYDDTTQLPEVQSSLSGCYKGSQAFGFCWGRAFAAHLKTLQSVSNPNHVKKLWAVGNLEGGGQDWRYHVATIVQTQNGWYTVDPFFGKIVPIEEWYSRMRDRYDPTKTMRIFITSPNRFTPEAFAGINKENVELETYHGFFIDLLDRLYKEVYGKPGPWEKIKDQQEKQRAIMASAFMFGILPSADYFNTQDNIK